MESNRAKSKRRDVSSTRSSGNAPVKVLMYGLQIAHFQGVPTLQTPISKNDLHEGQLDAPIQLIHYGDFQCPYSGALFSSLKRIQAEEGANFLYVFRQFPLGDIHPHAVIASRAAYAAHDQGAFWPMYEALFQNQSSLDPDSLKMYAENLGLDVARFESDVRSEKYDSQIEASIADGRASGAHGTPTVFINGQFHDNREGLWKFSRLQSALRAL